MIELLTWINDNFLSFVSIVVVLFWFFWLLIDKWKE